MGYDQRGAFVSLLAVDTAAKNAVTTIPVKNVVFAMVLNLCYLAFRSQTNSDRYVFYCLTSVLLSLD